MKNIQLFAFVILLFGTGNIFGQTQRDNAKIAVQLDKDGRVVVDGEVLVQRYDDTFKNDKVEAIAFRPTKNGKFPGILLIPGYSITARDWIDIGVRFAKEGFACVAVSQRGFGRSTGAGDCAGPKSLAALEAVFCKFRNEPYVDASRMGVYGYSLGASAASLLAVRLKADELHAAVFGGGVYDWKKAYDECKIPAIKRAVEKEAGLSKSAFRERNSLLQMANLHCPVLILHGAKDSSSSVSQAYMLRDKLAKLNKEFELKIFPNKGHSIGTAAIEYPLNYFKRKLVDGKASRK